jgi:hypothetical protein
MNARPKLFSISPIQRPMSSAPPKGSKEEYSKRRSERSISRYWILVALIGLTVLTRLLPYAISDLPFNNDGLTESRIADDISSSHHLDYPAGASYAGTHSVIMPIYDVFLAFVSTAIGVSASDIAQLTIAALSVLTVLAGYVLAIQITRGLRSAMLAAMTLALLGTFVFFTASTWKAAMGMSLFFLVILAYVNRGDKRFFVIELLVLLMIPAVHHLAAAVSYLAILYMTVWSTYFALTHRGIKLRHILDILLITCLSAGAYAFYAYERLDRLDLLHSSTGVFAAAISFVLLCAIMIIVLRMTKHSKMTFAPIVGIGLFVFLALDYAGSAVTYISGSPGSTLVLAAALSLLAGIAWYGMELLIESKSRYRAVQLCLLLPFLTLVGFSIFSSFRFEEQQILYRSFDYADMALALGVGVAFVGLKSRVRLRGIVVSLAFVALLVSLPFAYDNGTLTGVRHDTQQYEVDAFEWLKVSVGSSVIFQSGERLSYVAMATYDFEKSPRLPSRLIEEGVLGTNAYYALEDEWSTVGVNDFPRGHPVIPQEKIGLTLESSNILYIGGPSVNRIVIFTPSVEGQDLVLGID